MNLDELAKRVNAPPEGETILIYGGPRTGKSTLAASSAKAKRIKRVNWFDLENGQARLITMAREGDLTSEEAAKIRIFRIRDAVDEPYAFETMAKVLGLRHAIKICDEHGRDMTQCKSCTNSKGTFQTFDMKEEGPDTVNVIDTGSQWADSILHYYTKGEMLKGTSGLDAYREQGLRLVEGLTEIQRGKTNWIVITHEAPIELEAGTERIAAMDFKGSKEERKYPLIGTRAFCMKVGKYFGHIAYLKIRLRQHQGGSSSTYQGETITGSRTNWHIENQLGPDKKPLMSLVPLFDGK